ncbi:MAG: FGGY-family carbohydrate kinase, partial [Candidatus Thermoplasmatota archaeon]|nr:FGGY-family carbohydrate kinase [Candidatus Thermoplasmatota archaeon]
PVMVGGADTQCALVGSGCVKPGEVGIVAGTTMPVQMITEEPIWDKKRRIWTGCHSSKNQWNIESNAGMAGFVYKWLKESAINGKSANFEGRKPEISYDEMRQMAEKAPLGSNNTLSFLGTEIMDINDVYTIRPGIFMFPPPSNPMVENPMDLGCMIRATLENFCFAVKGNIEQISEISGISPKQAFVTGGLSKNTFWTQMLADVLGVPIKVAKVREGAGLGLAAMTAVGAGVYKNLGEAVKSMVSYENDFLPNLQNTEEYKSIFETWRENYNKFGDMARNR